MCKIRKLLFVDTNIWLDFYRAQNETALSLLQQLEKNAKSIISTYQLEMEFKNRQAAFLGGMNGLKAPAQIARPGFFSDAKAVAALPGAWSRQRRAQPSVDAVSRFHRHRAGRNARPAGCRFRRGTSTITSASS